MRRSGIGTSLRLLSPALRGEPSKLGVVRSVGISQWRTVPLQQIMDVPSQDHANSVNGIMPIEAFADETLQSLGHRCLRTGGHLALDHGMDGRVQEFVGELDARPPMKSEYGVELLQLAQRAPFHGIRAAIGS